MKTSLSLSMFVCCSLVSCEMIDPDAQISLPAAGMDPLDPVGFTRERSPEAVTTSSGEFRVGDYVEVSHEKTPMYAGYPRATTPARMRLEKGVVLNVLGLDGKYMHVQNEKGEEGYVSTTHVVQQGFLAADLSLDDIDLADIMGDSSVEE